MPARGKTGERETGEVGEEKKGDGRGDGMEGVERAGTWREGEGRGDLAPTVISKSRRLWSATMTAWL